MSGSRLLLGALVLVAAVGCSKEEPKAAQSTTVPTARSASVSASGTATASPSAESSVAPRVPSADESSMLARLAAIEYTKEVTAFTGPALTRADYQRQVNKHCADIKTLAQRTRPDMAEPDAKEVADWTTYILEEGGKTYARIASLRPPADMQAAVRNDFLKAYFEQLNAAERLFRTSLGDDRKMDPAVMKEALDAKKRLTVYAAKNDLTECV